MIRIHALMALLPLAIAPGGVAFQEDAEAPADSEVRERRKAYEDVLERELPFAWSEHFLVLADHDGFRFDKRKLGGKELAAEVATFAETVFADYCEVLGLDPKKEFTKRSEILLWEEQEDHEKVARDLLEWVAGEETEDWPIYRRGDRATYGLILDSAWAKDGAMLKRRLVHNIARGLLSCQKPSGLIGSTGNGWLSVGLGMWFEDRAYGTIASVDQRDLLQELPSKPGKWRAAVKKLVKRDKIEDFEALVASGEQQLDADGSLVVASLIDFLIAKDLPLFREFVLHMKNRSPTRDAVQVTYGWKMDEFEEAWSAWVEGTY
ncbi:MAG: hypothetical protein WD226_13125 [Planctomycetota bacterium]